MKDIFEIGDESCQLINNFIIFILCLFVCATLIGCSDINTPSAVPSPMSTETTAPVSHSPDIISDESTNLLVGYWANISQGFDGIDHLNGFYFAEDGTGFVFTSAEGAFLITSYNYSDDELSISFLNIEDTLVEQSYQIDSLSENELKITDDSNEIDIKHTYNRMLSIEPYNCLGGHTVTQIDGLIFDIMGY